MKLIEAFRLIVICVFLMACGDGESSNVSSGSDGQGEVTSDNSGDSDSDSGDGDSDSGDGDSDSGDTDNGGTGDVVNSDTSEPDAGQSSGDPLAVETLLKHWYDNYNEGSDQSYLTAKYEMLPDGSPDHPKAQPHEAHLNVAYGPYSRNRLDFFRVKGATAATPLVVYIHGGGFTNGDKGQIHKPEQVVDLFIKSGISVASVIYRWAYKDPELAKKETTPNGAGDTHNENGVRLDYIFRDCARAIQFLRYKADEWNIDKTRIGAWGGSAGAGCVMWTGTIPDLANPDADDPVLKESTHLKVVGHNNGQVTYNFPRWPELLNMDKDFVYSMIASDAERLTQLSLDDQSDLELNQQLSSLLDYYEHLGPDGPAIYTNNAAEDSDESTITNSSQVIHHPRGHVAIYERCVEMGLECQIKTPMKNSGYKGDMTSFLIEQLSKP